MVVTCVINIEGDFARLITQEDKKMNSAFAQDTFRQRRIFGGGPKDAPGNRCSILHTDYSQPDIVIVGLNHARFDDKDDKRGRLMIVSRRIFQTLHP